MDSRFNRVMGVIFLIFMFLFAFWLEARHTKQAADARQHEDERTWMAVDSVKKTFADSLHAVHADVDSVKQLLRNFVWIMALFSMGRIC